jgi:hypothetical protein
VYLREKVISANMFSVFEGKSHFCKYIVEMAFIQEHKQSLTRLKKIQMLQSASLTDGVQNAQVRK